MKAYARRFFAVLVLGLGCALAVAGLAAQQEPAVQSSPTADQDSPVPPAAQTGAQAPTGVTKPVDQSAPDNSVAPINADAGAPVGVQAQDATNLLLNTRIGPNYVIGPEDVLQIDVFDVPELSKLKVEVGNDGNISVPLLGRVKAAGLTQHQLRDELAEEWGKKYLQDPQVMLTIEEFKSRPVSVVGAVAKPGEYYLTGRRTLVEVLAMAGGPASLGAAAGKEVMVERPEGFQDLPQVDGLTQTAPDKVSIEMKKLLYSQDTDLNIEIKPFDIVSVSRAGIVYIVGAVTRPGGYVLDNKDSVSILEALAMAQGVGPNARTSEARIVRRSATGVQTSVAIDLKKVLAGKAPDVTLAANDILFVPNSASKAVGRQTLGTTLGILTGLVIYRGL
ncbi:MAG TPA: polysaccharide biosynthesis/export family protein [Terriglobia bacterium]|nr:polysaccharide biosynthesis/export family protein [Terriglobia bacterium]